jgi:hypothetical protein
MWMLAHREQAAELEGQLLADSALQPRIAG